MAPRAELAHNFVPMKTGECACVGGKEHMQGNREEGGPLASSPGGARESVCISQFPPGLLGIENYNNRIPNTQHNPIFSGYGSTF